jgi:predicted ATPase
VREKREIFNEKVQAGSRTYFFDVRVSSDGAKYLTISESRKTNNDKFDHDRIMIFDEHIENFYDALSKTMDFLRKTEN